MSNTLTIRVYRVENGWRVRTDLRTLDVVFIDLGSALDGCVVLAGSRPYRIVVEDDTAALARRVA